MEKELLRQIMTKNKETIEYISIFMNNGEIFSFSRHNESDIYDKIIFEDGIMTITDRTFEFYFNIEQIDTIKIRRKNDE